MGLPPWCREELRQRYAQAFGFECPNYEMVCVDMMQYIKGSLPDWVTSLDDLKRYFFSRIDQHFKSKAPCRVVVLCFDKDSPEVKRLVVHTKRYEKRCPACKAHNIELPKGRKAGQECFSPDCQRNCFENQILWSKEGPYLSLTDNDAPLPRWDLFSADSNNLRQELYPLFMNWVLEYIPLPGQMLFTHGLPCSSRVVMDYSADFHKGFHSSANVEKRTILIPWLRDNLPLDKDATNYDRVYMMKGVAPCQQYPRGHIQQEEVPDMYNTILEADNAVFFYSRFFPEFRVHMAHINDGDAISIGLLRTIEDYKGNQPAQEQWLALRYASKKGRSLLMDAEGEGAPTVEYVNLTLLYQKIESTPMFIKNGVQSPTATMIFLLVIADSDFFQGEFCFGIGSGPTQWSDDEKKRNRQTMGVWDTFFSKIDMFSHLVQYYSPTKSLTEKRRIVIDEDLFAIFTEFCYSNKYEKLAKNDSVRVYCSKLKDKRKHFPGDGKMRRWARQVGWNLNYWANAFRDIYIDPFEEYLDAPYWGYHREHGIVDVVSSKQHKLDETHKRHMWRRMQKEKEVAPIATKKKKLAMEAIRGNVK